MDEEVQSSSKEVIQETIQKNQRTAECIICGD
jgi:hypothetical protein